METPEPIATIVLDRDGFVMRVECTEENKRKLYELWDTTYGDHKVLEVNRRQ